MAEPTKPKKWSDVKARLEAFDRKGLVSLLGDVRAQVRARLGRIQMRAQDLGWGFSDAVDDVVHALDARAARVRPGPGESTLIAT